MDAVFCSNIAQRTLYFERMNASLLEAREDIRDGKCLGLYAVDCPHKGSYVE